MFESIAHKAIEKKLFYIKRSIALSEKRKDSKGRILKTGESQRKDGTYMYHDIRRNREAVYASTLEELRAKETSI